MRQPIALREIAIGGVDLADAAHREAVRAHPRAKRAIDEDRELRRRIAPVEISGRVCFG